MFKVATGILFFKTVIAILNCAMPLGKGSNGNKGFRIREEKERKEGGREREGRKERKEREKGN